MNADRRIIGKVVIALLTEAQTTGEISDETHETVSATLDHLHRAENTQLRLQSKHAGKNPSTDKQIAICSVALPAIEEAVRAWGRGAATTVVRKLKLAIETDGQPPAPRRKK